MYKKLLAFLLAILCIMSCAVIGVSAEDTDSQSNVLYFRVPESWTHSSRIYCHITILDTGESFTSWQSKKERCTQVEGNLYVYDLSQASIEIMDECYAIFSSDVGYQTHPIMLRYGELGGTAYCDGTMYENVADRYKTTYAVFWEGENPEEYGPVMMISTTGNVVGTCKSQYDQTNEDMFKSFLKYDLHTAQQESGKTDQQLIDDIIIPFGFSDYTADRIIRSIGGINLAWGKGYGDAVEPVIYWNYKVVDGEVILTGFKSDDTELNIPDTIDGMPVTGIEGETFFYGIVFNPLTINIPSSIKNISMPEIVDYKYYLISIKEFNVHPDNPAYSSVDGILYNKDKTTLMSYPTHKEDKVCTVDEATTYICDSAFYGGRFEKIILPENLTNIPKNAFLNCVWLKELNIPASVTFIDSDAFTKNVNLKAINVSPENKNYCSIDGVLYNKDKTELLYFPLGNGIESYKVSDGVTKIGKRAFQAFSSLDEIILPDSVETVSYRAFYGCGAEINIPANLKVIEDEGFAACGITQAILPEGITEIGYRAFMSTNIETLTLPESLTYIGVEAFYNTPITSVVIPGSVSTIDEGAFNSCSNLQEITIPESVTYIGENAFDYCAENLVIIGKEGSYAEEYAKNNNIKFADLSKILTGDVNFDGDINIKDATAIQKHLAEISVFSDTVKTLADYDTDGEITIKDATAIQKFIAGIVG
ncbi:MAG: hypothetical protein E7563_06435 [Ruminococcaceae bacterium]|nr:hypothetical protein [Oscillospiraceae bacterium]